MPPKKETDKDNSSKTFSFDDVAYLVAKLDANNIGLGMKDYQIMAELNGTRSDNGYQHLFRTVKARGKDLVPLIAAANANASPAKAAGGAKAKADGEKKVNKRGKKARDEESPDNDDDESPKKKAKKGKAASEEAEADAPVADDEFN